MIYLFLRPVSYYQKLIAIVIRVDFSHYQQFNWVSVADKGVLSEVPDFRDLIVRFRPFAPNSPDYNTSTPV